jgi:hypothetical protein
MRQSGGGDLVRYGAEQFGVGGPLDSALWGIGVLAFHTRYSGNSNALYFDGTYSLRQWVTGLQLRDRLIWTNGARINGGQAFVYNRVMFEYHLRS